MANDISGTLSTLGVGSNLDINSILSKLQQVENAPLTALNKQSVSYQSKISSLGKISSALSSFYSGLSGMKNDSSYINYTGTSSDNVVSNIQTTSTSGGLSHTINVSKLAETAKTMSSVYTSADSIVGTGTLTFTFGAFNLSGFQPDSSQNIVNIDITASDSTLSGIAAKINSSNIGVKANVLNDGSGYRLIMTSDKSGAKNAFTVDVTDNDTTNTNTSGLSNLTYNTTITNMQSIYKGANASFKLDGIDISSESNTLTNIVPGLTFTLNNVSKDSTTNTNITLNENTTITNTNINGFVSSFNSVIKSIQDAQGSKDNKTPLQGEFMLSQIKNKLSEYVMNSKLPQMGISFQKDGTLSVDNTKLDSYIKSNLTDIKETFNATTTGLSDKLSNYIDSLTNSTGVFKGMTDTYQKNLDRISKQTSVLNTRIDNNMARYKKQFIALDQLLSNMNSTSSSLTQSLNRLNTTA